MHKSFFPLFLLTLLIVIGTTFFLGETRWISILLGLLPLVTYHTLLIRKKDPLSPNEVDSVYYFGFLVTVMTLVATAVSMALKKSLKLDVNSILLQFGLGLGATGYALFARLHLLSKLNNFSEMDVLTSTEKLVHKVDNIASELTRAQNQITAFISLSEQNLNEIKTKFDKNISEAERTFAENLKETEKNIFSTLNSSCSSIMTSTSSTINAATMQFSQAISCIMEEIGRIQDEAEAISFSLASEKIAAFASELTTSMSAITSTATQTATEANEAIAELTKASRKMHKLASQITVDAESLQSLHDLVKVADNIVTALDILVQSATASGKALSALEITIGQTNNDIHEQIIGPLRSSSLSHVLSGIADSSQEILALNGQTKSFASQLQRLSTSLESCNTSITSNDIAPKLQLLNEQIHKLALQANKIAQTIYTHRGQLDAAFMSVTNELSHISPSSPALGNKMHNPSSST